MTTSYASPTARYAPLTHGRPLASLLTIAFICFAYVGSAELGFRLAFATKQVTAVWPPTGIALAAFALCGARVWPGVFLGAFLSNAMSHEPIFTAAGIAAGNTLGPFVGAYALRRLAKIDWSLTHVRDILALTFFGSALAMIITASNGVVNLAFGGVIPWAAIFSVWPVWWVGDAMGALLVAPVILTFFTEEKAELSLRQTLELLILAAILVATTATVFSTHLPLAYPVFPIVIWVALRFGQRETSVAVLIVSAIAVWQTVHDRGPFIVGSFDSRLAMLVTFMAVLAIMGLVLGALAAERRRAEGSLRKANDELEARVRDRTAELVATNQVLERRTAELARKNEEVEAFVYIVSHDLRVPLVNLQGFSRELHHSCTDLEDALKSVDLPLSIKATIRSAVTDGIRGSLEYISASVDKFEALINALLVLSRTGQQDYHLETIDVQGLLTVTLGSFQQALHLSESKVRVGELPPVRADVTALGQVFANLIDNALKYSEPGRPGQIEVAGKVEGEWVRYWVSDNGVGIPATALPRVFNVFQRFHPHLASGEGIGLASIKRIVERLGGRIWIESEAGVGSTFHFTLPNASAIGHNS